MSVMVGVIMKVGEGVCGCGLRPEYNCDDVWILMR